MSSKELLAALTNQYRVIMRTRDIWWVYDGKVFEEILTRSCDPKSFRGLRGNQLIQEWGCYQDERYTDVFLSDFFNSEICF